MAAGGEGNELGLRRPRVAGNNEGILGTRWNLDGDGERPNKRGVTERTPTRQTSGGGDGSDDGVMMVMWGWWWNERVEVTQSPKIAQALALKLWDFKTQECQGRQQDCYLNKTDSQLIMINNRLHNFSESQSIVRKNWFNIRGKTKSIKTYNQL